MRRTIDTFLGVNRFDCVRSWFKALSTAGGEIGYEHGTSEIKY